MNWEILRKYVKGTCTEHELRQIGEWLQENPANEDFFKSYIEQWNQREGDFEADVQTAWQHFKKRYNFPHPPRARRSASSPASSKHLIRINNTTVQKRGALYWLSFAAAAMILIAGLFFTTQYWTEDVEQAQQNTEIEAQEIATSKGQRTHLRLSDGTRVTLNAESKLKIPENYGEPDRTLYLEGEAFFEVQHDEAHPFIVISPQGYVKDLGTQFNIMVYDSSRIEVALKEGLASLGSVEKGAPADELVELSPNKVGVLKRGGGLTYRILLIYRPTPDGRRASWYLNKLLFPKSCSDWNAGLTSNAKSRIPN